MKKKEVIRTTERQKKFVENKLKGMSSYKAAQLAGYSDNTSKNANDNISEHRGTLQYTNAIGASLAKLGVTPEFMAEKIKEGLDAKNKEGNDFKTRLDYIKYSAELQGLQKAKEVNLNIKTISDVLDSLED